MAPQTIIFGKKRAATVTRSNGRNYFSCWRSEKEEEGEAVPRKKLLIRQNKNVHCLGWIAAKFVFKSMRPTFIITRFTQSTKLVLVWASSHLDTFSSCFDAFLSLKIHFSTASKKIIKFLLNLNCKVGVYSAYSATDWTYVSKLKVSFRYNLTKDFFSKLCF